MYVDVRDELGNRLRLDGEAGVHIGGMESRACNLKAGMPAFLPSGEMIVRSKADVERCARVGNAGSRVPSIKRTVPAIPNVLVPEHDGVRAPKGAIRVYLTPAGEGSVRVSWEIVAVRGGKSQRAIQRAILAELVSHEGTIHESADCLFVSMSHEAARIAVKSATDLVGGFGFQVITC